MEIITFIIVGLVAGWLAGLIMKGKGLGFLGNIVVGIIGAIIGGFLLGLLGMDTSGFLGSLIAAVIGATILLFLVSLAKPKSYQK